MGIYWSRFQMAVCVTWQYCFSSLEYMYSGEEEEKNTRWITEYGKLWNIIACYCSKRR